MIVIMTVMMVMMKMMMNSVITDLSIIMNTYHYVLL